MALSYPRDFRTTVLLGAGMAVYLYHDRVYRVPFPEGKHIASDEEFDPKLAQQCRRINNARLVHVAAQGVVGGTILGVMWKRGASRSLLLFTGATWGGVYAAYGARLWHQMGVHQSTARLLRLTPSEVDPPRLRKAWDDVMSEEARLFINDMMLNMFPLAGIVLTTGSMPACIAAAVFIGVVEAANTSRLLRMEQAFGDDSPSMKE